VTGIDIALAVLLGGSAVLHRISGVGFALVTFPVLVILYGPVEGLAIGFLLGLSISILLMAQSWRHVMLRRALYLSLPAVVTVPIGAALVRLADPYILTLAIGCFLLFSLFTARRRWSLLDASTGPTMAVGAAAGFVHVTSGLSVPVLTSYAISTKWDQQQFAASAQVIFVILNCGSLAALGLTSTALLSAGKLLPVVLLGSFLGLYLQRRLSAGTAQKTVVVVVAASAVGAIVRGLEGLIG